MKKFIKSMTSIILIFAFSQSVYAYNFPDPDWGALLAERKQMATETDFELYAEGSLNSAKYYGARLEPRSGCYIGMTAAKSEQYAPLGSYLTYVESMYQKDIYYPDNKFINENNAVVTIGWTVTSLDSVDYDGISQTLEMLDYYNKPMFIRFANEMNESSLGDDPTKYIEVFRKVANMVHKYDNFAVVWSPNDFGALNRPFEYYYPGDEYVDWIGLSCYSIKYFGGKKDSLERDTIFFMTGDYSWHTNRVKPLFDFMKKKNIQKPVMISEGGVSTNNHFGEDLQSWAAPRLRNMLWYLVMKYPQIKLINYFNTSRAYEVQRYDLDNYQYAVDIFKEASKSGAYIREYGEQPKFVYQPADKGETLSASSDGIIRLYTLAYIFQKPDITVNYHVDGKWYRSSNKIPYTCNLNVNDFSDGEHTLKVSCDSASKKYTFYKKGTYIRFGKEPDLTAVSTADSIVQPTNKPIKITFNGSDLKFEQAPIIKNGSTLVPLRAIFEALGAKVEWQQETKTIFSYKDDTVVRLSIGDKKIYVNLVVKPLDVPAQLVNNTTMVPVRAISEAFGCSVKWDNENRTVIITQ